MEYALNGNLFSFIRKEKTIDKNFLKSLFLEVCSAIEYLHSKNIIHRDIKPENILLDKNYTVKVCDFGWSTDIDQIRNTFCGTHEYMAPEIFQYGKYGKEVDVWGLGVLLYELHHGYSPFRASSIFKIY